MVRPIFYALPRLIFGPNLRLISCRPAARILPFKHQWLHLLPSIVSGEVHIRFLCFCTFTEDLKLRGFYLVILITVVIHLWLADLQRVLWADSLRSHFQRVAHRLSASYKHPFFFKIIFFFLFPQILTSSFCFYFNINFLWAI